MHWQTWMFSVKHSVQTTKLCTEMCTQNLGNHHSKRSQESCHLNDRQRSPRPRGQGLEDLLGIRFVFRFRAPTFHCQENRLNRVVIAHQRAVDYRVVVSFTFTEDQLHIRASSRQNTLECLGLFLWNNFVAGAVCQEKRRHAAGQIFITTD
mmetsp:Transcript_32349/g.77388  ORF Transcript_32349/g.77388 Transcript_32349/m.77388 type:complete len:151 (+) Transcript_32349:153-605(+)